MNIEAAELIDLICTHLFFHSFDFRHTLVMCSPASFFDSPFFIVERGTTRIKSWGWVGFACALRREEDPFPILPSLSTTATCSESARLFVLLVKMPIHSRRDNTHLWEVSDTRYLRIVAGQPTSSGPRRR